MPEVELRPIRETTSDYDAIEAEIMRIFREEIYLPLVKDVGAPKKAIQNSIEDLISAIAKGRVSFHQGRFTGRINAKLAREIKAMGGSFKDGAWHIRASYLSPDVWIAVQASDSRFERTIKKIDERLRQILPEQIAEKVQLNRLFNRQLWKVDGEVRQTLKAITVVPKMTEHQSQRISQEYTQDLQRYIKDFTEKEIEELRTKIQSKSLKGYRYEGMVKVIQKSYEVSQNKAKFLARQETSLMMTKFKQVRYEDAGVNKYKWGCVAGSAKHPVRPMHKALEGKVFEWSNPPVTNSKGQRNNPGQDYNCRCFARPIVKF